jgi:broad specificity phosphatase PhoE
MAHYIQSFALYPVYLQNKNAYIHLKAMRPQCKTIIFASHNSRMRCFVESVTPSSVYDKYKSNDPHPKAYRFKNCAMLSVRLKVDCPHAVIELVYSGHVEDNTRQEGMYYIKEGETSDSDHDRPLETQHIPLKDLGIDSFCVNHNMEILIIRHGEAEHNINSYYSQPIAQAVGTNMGASIKDNKLDTNLTARGVEETQNAAKFLAEYLKNKSVSLDHVFCSVLKRTRQTIDVMLSHDDMKECSKSIKKMVIAPCSREIKYGDVRGCFIRDPDPAFYDNLQNKDDLRFNQPFCSYLTKEHNELEDECKKLSNLEIDATYYIDYHKNSKCSGLTSSMVATIVDVTKKLDCIE